MDCNNSFKAFILLSTSSRKPFQYSLFCSKSAAVIGILLAMPSRIEAISSNPSFLFMISFSVMLSLALRAACIRESWRSPAKAMVKSVLIFTLTGHPYWVCSSTELMQYSHGTEFTKLSEPLKSKIIQTWFKAA
ncbi:hypothetical protein C8R44DRAFT_821881 [Mycena epipterygia]|nr:hypothetical protein C8R44DRAFT_821881 [Mycena epipterygia]